METFDQRVYYNILQFQPISPRANIIRLVWDFFVTFSKIHISYFQKKIISCDFGCPWSFELKLNFGLYVKRAVCLKLLRSFLNKAKYSFASFYSESNNHRIHQTDTLQKTPCSGFKPIVLKSVYLNTNV